MNIKVFFWRTGLAGLALACALASPARAAPIHIEFEGLITQAAFDPADPYAGAIQALTPFSGVFRFDPAAPNTSADPSIGSYGASGAPFGMTVTIGGVAFHTDESAAIGIANDVGAGVDQYAMVGMQGAGSGLSPFLTVAVFLQDDAGLALEGIGLRAPPSVGLFKLRSFSLDALSVGPSGDVLQMQLQGVVTALAVPEPPTIALYVVGLALLFASADRRRRPASASGETA